MNKKIKELTASQQRMLAALADNMENFFYSDSNNRDDSMIFALDNGWTIHAVDCFSGTGATDKYFDRVYSRLVKSVGSEKWNELNRNEAQELCKYARIQVCKHCNHHSFTDPYDESMQDCPCCLKAFPKIA